MRGFLFATILIALSTCWHASIASASFVSIPVDSKVAPRTEIGVRIQLGVPGIETSLYDTTSIGQSSPALNPGGRPFSTSVHTRSFEVGFDSTSGELGLKLDLNGNGQFETGEQIFRTTFSNPGISNYSGRTFEYLSILGDDGGSSSRSRISNLQIGGQAFSNIEPRGGTSEVFFRNQNLSQSSISVTGDLTFVTSGRGQERPKWDFVFRSSIPTVPEPSSFAIFGFGALCMLARRRSHLR